MEKPGKTWVVEIIGATILTALLGLWGWTATKVVEVSESVVEVKAELGKVEAELQKEIAEVKAELREEITEVRAELGREIATLNAKMDLLISGLNITVAPKDEAGAEVSGG